MRRAGKLVLWIFVICMLIWGAYFLYQKWWGSPDGSSTFGKVEGTFLEKLSDAGEFIKEKTSKTFEKAAINSYSYAKKGTGGAISSIGEGLESIGTRISGDTNSAASSPVFSVTSSVSSTTIPLSSPGFFIPPPLFSISGKIGEIFPFSLNREGKFIISWGDGAKEEIFVGKNETKNTEHIWTRKGDFEVVMAFSSGTERETWKFFVRIHD